MKLEESNQNMFGKEYLSHIAVECVLFAFCENQMKVLLFKSKVDDIWGLPGGFVLKKETLEEAANRILRERTSFEDVFFTQFHIFNGLNRVHPLFTEDRLLKLGIPKEQHVWLNQRFLPVGFYALVHFSDVTSIEDEFNIRCEWRNIDELGELMMDHNEIVTKAQEAVRLQIRYQPIGINLLPEKFTMPELQKLYEAILGRELDRRNFQRKILSYGILERLTERRVGVAHKAPYLYRFHMENYNKAHEEGLQGSW